MKKLVEQITQTFKLQNLQEHNSGLLKLLTEHLPDMLWVKDIDGKYIYTNKAICEGLLMAKDTEEPIGKNDVFFAKRERELHKENPHYHTFGELCFNSDLEVIKHNKPMKFEEYGNVKGEMLYLEVFKAPFHNEKGEIIGTVGAGRDITELKKIQLDLEEKNRQLAHQSEEIERFNKELEKRVQEEITARQKQESIMLHQSRQAAMGELLESIAHQWRQPLNIIGLAGTTLDTQCQLGEIDKEAFHEKMQIIFDNIRFMSETIDDFRNFLNPLRKVEYFSIKECIEQTLHIFTAQLKTYKIEAKVHDGCVELSRNNCCSYEIEGVENEFKQVLFILLNNAIDAIKVFRNQENTTRSIDLYISCEEGNMIVDVVDNGGGVNKKNSKQIFDAYFTTKSDSYGTGVGLYIAKNIIEKRMRGSISHSNTKEGSDFCIKLPMYSKAE